MTDPTYTDITMVLDRSGSMQSIKDDSIGGFDAFISEQRRLPARKIGRIEKHNGRIARTDTREGEGQKTGKYRKRCKRRVLKQRDHAMQRQREQPDRAGQLAVLPAVAQICERHPARLQ